MGSCPRITPIYFIWTVHHDLGHFIQWELEEKTELYWKWVAGQKFLGCYYRKKWVQARINYWPRYPTQMESCLKELFLSSNAHRCTCQSSFHGCSGWMPSYTEGIRMGFSSLRWRWWAYRSSRRLEVSTWSHQFNLDYHFRHHLQKSFNLSNQRWEP